MEFILDREFFDNLLTGMDNLQVFSLTEEFGRLSLNDTGQSSNLSLTNRSWGGLFQSFLSSVRHSIWNQSINEQLRAPFVEIPRSFIESFQQIQTDSIRIGLGLRIHPESFILNEFQMQQSSFNRLSIISDALGLYYSCNYYSPPMLLSLSHSGVGLRAVVNPDDDRLGGVLVEVITQVQGIYGRFLILVCLGIGCTVWYGFENCTNSIAPTGELFAPIKEYALFYNIYYNNFLFRNISFVETKDLSGTVSSALDNEFPFTGINIPASGNVHTAAGLGLMLAFFLAVGILPNTSL